MEQIALKSGITADELVSRILRLSDSHRVFLLDSCGAPRSGPGRLICGIGPARMAELSDDDPDVVLQALESACNDFPFVFFTLSYDLGTKIQNIRSRHSAPDEPDLYLAAFSAVVVHDYATGQSSVVGEHDAVKALQRLIESSAIGRSRPELRPNGAMRSNFDGSGYAAAVETLRERIRDGATYQTNLTQQIHVTLSEGDSPADVFRRLRIDHPAPFAAFANRGDSFVVSASPERFFAISGDSIIASPIKGTRPRGRDAASDARFRSDLETSEKDRAENIMIVDLLRNDLGRVCEFGSVTVEKLCEIEEHPSIFHLVSTIGGRLRPDVSLSDSIRALFPCGSITGAPKISTMRIIDGIETARRGLSMGAIGYFAGRGIGYGAAPVADLSVAIRTMVIRGGEAVFNVGGGIVIDSEPDDEYAESMLKASALLKALGAD